LAKREWEGGGKKNHSCTLLVKGERGRKEETANDMTTNLRGWEEVQTQTSGPRVGMGWGVLHKNCEEGLLNKNRKNKSWDASGVKEEATPESGSLQIF